MTFDLVIQNARLVDGTGSPWRWADVAVADGRVVAIGSLDSRASRHTIEAAGRVLAPGFIDLHSHSDRSLLADSYQSSSISQGVTTVLIGQDGLGIAPVAATAADRVAHLVEGLLGSTGDWEHGSIGDLLARVDRRSAVNVATLIPYGTVRCDVLGGEDRAPDRSEHKRILLQIEQGMVEGAFGLSTGLEYEPQTACTTEELVQVMRVVARSGGMYVSHIRDYDEEFFPALEEALSIGRSARVPVHLSHLHCYGPRNRGRPTDVSALLESARSEGIDVTFDIYPYTVSTTYAHYFAGRTPSLRNVAALRSQLAIPSLRAQLVARIENEGLPNDVTWDDCTPAAGAHTIGGGGKSLADLAQERGSSAAALLVELLERTDFTASLSVVSMSQDDVDAMVCHPLASLGSDGILHGEQPHPRGWGAFAKIVRDYVRERSLLRLEDAIALLSGRAAARLGLTDRGVLRPGAWADLVLFDPDRAKDTASYETPRQLAHGFDLVATNGVVVWESGRPTGTMPGMALRSTAGAR